MTITLRGTKGSALTHAEMDGNFTDLDGRVITALADSSDAQADATQALLDAAAAQADADTATALAATYTAATASALETAYPAASNAGRRASVGSSAPYAYYVSDGVDWLPVARIATDGYGNATGLLGPDNLMLNLITTSGYTYTNTGNVTYAEGDTMIDLGQALSAVTLAVIPTSGELGIDYTLDAIPDVATGNWIAVYGGNASDAANITFSAAITGLRLRPIAAGADWDYVVTAPAKSYFMESSVSYAGGNDMVTLPQAMTGITISVVGVTGEIGLDYTTDALPDVSTGNWIEVYGGAIASNESVTFTARITGLRLRPIAAGAAATYQARG